MKVQRLGPEADRLLSDRKAALPHPPKSGRLSLCSFVPDCGRCAHLRDASHEQTHSALQVRYEFLRHELTRDDFGYLSVDVETDRISAKGGF